MAKSNRDSDLEDIGRFLVSGGAGDHVFREGDPGSEMFIIEEGEIEILKTYGPATRRLAVLEHHHGGQAAALEHRLGRHRRQLLRLRARIGDLHLGVDAGTAGDALRQVELDGDGMTRPVGDGEDLGDARLELDALADVEPREVLLWAQTRAPARVKFVYWDEEAPALRYETAEQPTVRAEGHVARLVADEVAPGRRYGYELWIDGARVERPYPLRFQAKPALRFFRGAGQAPPAAPTVRVAAGSCYYANDPDDPQGWNPGGEYAIFEAIRAERPDLMLWLGDNVYMRDVDWTSRTGLIRRYSYTRAVPELQPLLGSVHHYATWDDHDYGPNDSDRSYRDKELSREVFRLFWGNPSHGVEGSPGITTRFTWADVEFFLLDDRWNRSPNLRHTGPRRMLGEAQIEWLIDALAGSSASFKVVVNGGQVLNPARVAETYANFPEEREELLRRIATERVRGVLFLSGDRHFSELSRLERPGSYPLHDFTVSPLRCTQNPSMGEEWRRGWHPERMPPRASDAKVLVVGGGPATQGPDLVMNPLGGGVARVVLTWGATPSDLDSHMTGPTTGGARFWRYYASPGNCQVAPFVCLDVDDVSGHGPETMTIGQLTPGVYRYYVYDFSNRTNNASTALGSSGAKVQLFIGGQVHNFFVPSGTGNAWAVFTWDGTTVTPLNQLYTINGTPQPARLLGLSFPDAVQADLRRLLDLPPKR